jgi:hypothetical protein
VVRRLALVPPRASVLPPGAGNEPKKPIKARKRAKKRKERYVGKRIVVDRDVDAAAVRRDHDGDLAAVLAIETAQHGLHGASPTRIPRAVRAV